MRSAVLFLFSLLFVVTLSTSVQPPEVNPQCVKTLWKMIGELQAFAIFPDPTSLSNVTLNFITLSGRFINDFGEYETCQNKTSSRYLTLLFTGNQSNTTFDALIGFCGPTVCSSADTLNQIDIVFDLYRQGMALPLQNLTTASSCSFYDPSVPVSKDAGTAIVVILLVSLAMLVVVATGNGILKEFQDERNAKRGLEERLLPDNSDANSVTASESASQAKPELRGFKKFLDCFDARKNFDKIVNIKYTDSYDYNLEIFNGIRVFMMLYVVFGHTFLFGTGYIDNLPDIQDFISSHFMLVLNAALYSVDVFFYMSGFLFAYIGLGKLKKMKPTPINFIALAIHRLLRFWPTYLIAILFFWKVLPLLGQGPVWFNMTYYTDLCNSTYWQNFLLIDDLLVKSADYCYGWGWYLSNDYQMFLMTPIFIWLYARHKTFGKLSMMVLICCSWIMALIIGAKLHIRATPPKAGGMTNPQGFSEYYVKPYIRLPPYFIGVLVALMYKEYKEEHGVAYKIGKFLRKKNILLSIIEFLGYVTLFAITFVPRPLQKNDHAWPDWVHVSFRAFSKSWYVIGLSMIMVPILLGKNTLFKRFMSHPLFVPLARVSFTAYLVHLCWIYRNYYNETFSFHFTYENGTLATISNGAAAFLGGLILSLLIEVPMANIETTYISGGKRSKSRNNKLKPKITEEKTILNATETSIIPVVSDSK